MPREIITLQVGQCGNQIGCRFWDLALREHSQYSKNGLFDEAMSTFFRNIDARTNREIPIDDGKHKIAALKARALLIDMEEGVLKELLKGYLGDLFDDTQFISDVSGSGNNFTHGHCVYGPQYRDKILEKCRKAAESCDSLQSFFLLHSLGGGTGSGLGTYILRLLEDEFPNVYRFTTSVFPSTDDDVIISPYNSVLALKELINHADCVLPIDNQSLIDITKRVDEITKKKQVKSSIHQSDTTKKPFDSMNNIAAHLLTHLTSSMRFEGSLNVDLNEITTNLVPYPKLHFLVSSLSPLVLPLDVHLPPRRLNQMFTDALSKDYQLLKADPKRNKYLACGFFVRGDAQISDINRNIQRIKSEIDMVYWNQEGFKVGLCKHSSIGQPYSLLCLANNCCFVDTLQQMEFRFQKLFRKKLYAHHYEKFTDKDMLLEALESLLLLKGEYQEIQNAKPPKTIPRFIPDY